MMITMSRSKGNSVSPVTIVMFLVLVLCTLSISVEGADTKDKESAGQDESKLLSSISRSLQGQSCTPLYPALSGYEFGAPNTLCDSTSLSIVDSEAECAAIAALPVLAITSYVPMPLYINVYPCGCQYDCIFLDTLLFNPCTSGELPGNPSTGTQPICKVPAADGGGDPHYKMFSRQLVTVQALCDLMLLHSDAFGGVRIHSRHSMPLIDNQVDKGYSIISNLAMSIGPTDVWELIADGPILFKNGIEFDSFEDEESGNGRIEEEDQHEHSYSVTKRTKGQRKNIIEYVFTFADHSKVIFRGNKHFKMTFIEVHGFASDSSVVGFLGRTNGDKTFYSRLGDDMTSEKYHLRSKKGTNKFSIEQYAQEWQVRADEPDLFMNKSDYPVAPQKCSFLDKGSIEGLVDTNLIDSGNGNSNLLEDGRRGRRRLAEDVVDEGAMVMAMEACNHLSDGNPKKKFCIEDVMKTNEAEIALDSFYEE